MQTGTAADVIVPGLLIAANVAILCFAVMAKKREHRRDRPKGEAHADRKR